MGDKPEQKPEQKPADIRRCLDNRWRYTPANETDVRKTWQRFGWIPPIRRTV